MKGASRALILILLSITIVVCITSVHNMGLYNHCSPTSFEKILSDPKRLVIPAGNCNCTISYTSNERLLPIPSMSCNCRDPTVCPVCQPPQVQIVEKEVVKEVIKTEDCPNVVPWHAEGKSWHYPARFPLCSMDVCFDYGKCENSEEHLIYTYDLPTSPKRYFSIINESKYFTNDPQKACIFLVFLDNDDPWPPHPNTLPYWNEGKNHVLVIFADKWFQKGPPQDTIGFASIMASDIHETTYRAGFDISIPLPGKFHITELQSVKPLDRKYLASFRGLRYLGATGEGTFRSHDSFRQMHNGVDVIVATSCDHFINNLIREKEPELGRHCDEDELVHKNYSFVDLMNSTFALVPAGIQPASYRFIEVLSAGSIPVLIADNYVKPFDTVILWYKCLIQFSTTEMHRIIGTLRAMKEDEILKRQKNCLQIYNEFLKDDETLLRSSVRALKARFFGAIPGLSEVKRRR